MTKTLKRTSTRPASSKLDRAMAQMAIGTPNEQSMRVFFSVLCQCPLVLTDTVPTAAIDAKHRIYCNPTFFESLTPAEVRGVLAHEVFHGILGHFPRMRDREAKRWNYATDAIVNAQLTQMGYTLPDGVVRDHRGLTHTEEALYAELDQTPPPSGGRAAGLRSDLSDAPATGPGEEAPATAAEAQQAHEALQRAFVRAVQQEQRMTGTVAGPLASLYADLTAPVRWTDLLNDCLTGMASRDESWTRPNKRLRRIAYLPSQQPQPSLGHVTVLLDVSGSISAAELADARGHILGLLDQCPPSRLDLLTADTRLVQLDRDIQWQSDDLPPTPVTHGGTDLEAAMAELDADDIPDVCIVLTDGHTPFAADRPWPHTRFVWVMSTTQTAPYGITIPMPRTT
jgi:predicted metal-dependent peptidase